MSAWAQKSEIRHYSRVRPKLLGDANDLVAILCLNFEGLEFIVCELESHNFNDEFVKELRAALEEQRALLELEAGVGS